MQKGSEVQHSKVKRTYRCKGAKIGMQKLQNYNEQRYKNTKIQKEKGTKDKDIKLLKDSKVQK